mgnify:CR=1 FL=1
MIGYLNIRKWDMLLCAIMTFAITITVFAGFNATDESRNNLAFLIIGSAILTVFWFLVFYSRRTIIIGVIAVVAALVVILFAASANGVSLFTDNAENAYLKFVLLIAASFGVVILSRFQLGSILLFPCGIFLIALIEFMYSNKMVLPLLLFLCAAGMMIMYRNYITNILHSATVKIAPGRSVLMSLIMVLLVTSIAGGVFFAVVKPLNPPSRDVELLTKYMSLDVLEKLGVADVRTIHDLEENANNNQTEEMTVEKQSDQDDQKDKEKGKSKSKSQLEREEWIKYHRDLLITGIPVLLAAIIAAVILLRLWFRKRKYQKMKEMDLSHRIPAFYQYFLNCFRHVGINRRPDETPYEFAARAGNQTRDFDVGGVGIEALTETYVAIRYGLREITNEELDGYDVYYNHIFKSCRKRLGLIKYIICFFAI